MVDGEGTGLERRVARRYKIPPHNQGASLSLLYFDIAYLASESSGVKFRPKLTESLLGIGQSQTRLLTAKADEGLAPTP